MQCSMHRPPDGYKADVAAYYIIAGPCSHVITTLREHWFKLPRTR